MTIKDTGARILATSDAPANVPRIRKSKNGSRANTALFPRAPGSRTAKSCSASRRPEPRPKKMRARRKRSRRLALHENAAFYAGWDAAKDETTGRLGASLVMMSISNGQAVWADNTQHGCVMTLVPKHVALATTDEALRWAAAKAGVTSYLGELCALEPDCLTANSADVLVSEVWVPVRRDPPKIIAHHPILVERVTCPDRPHGCNYDGKTHHACKADDHDGEIIARKLPRAIPTTPDDPRFAVAL